MKNILEVCVDNAQSALAAQEGAADRIELCGNLIIGGTSPGKKWWTVQWNFEETV